ncbi:neutral/alkaline non-lysosomal ceramidase N-terminal domain-containing protein [Schlesneria paludicola]|uniref:neutral/alkaline non-lysosomal ceramidase N-terminal domain-containing protein n=1 Tax=Schlesneria paludicola TaxID=360056 RepID=UPI00029B1AB2|nr:neutral/alkaline non-lysosomal ceramidase N-terminal domain-containing protein [Schlesneria paludicola]
MTSQKTPESRCLVGVSQCDITPPVGIYHRMWGAATHERSTGVHRPLMATVLLMQADSKQASDSRIIIALDHCLFWTEEMNRFLDVVSTKAKVSRDAIVVFFSHTHGAGLMGLERRSFPGGELIEPYLDELAIKVINLIADCQERLTPATIVYGSGRCSMAKHRDFFDTKNGHYVCGFNPDGSTDETVLVGRVVSEAGAPLATIVNYACHPTTLAWDNTLISPDYIGAMRELVEDETGVPVVFIQGASGDVGPREGFVGDLKVADRNGRQLGYAVLSTLESLPPAGQEFEYQGPVVSGATIGTWAYRTETPVRRNEESQWTASCPHVSLKYRDDLPVLAELKAEKAQWEAEKQQAIAAHDDDRSRRAHAMIERSTRRMTRVEFLPPGESFPYPIRMWRNGDAVWIALDGEHYNILQRTLRERFPNAPLVIGTLANGSNVWYLPDADSYGLGLYQEEVSVLAKGSLEAVIDATIIAVQQLLADK